MPEKAPEPPTRLVYRVPISYVEVCVLIALFMAWSFALMFFRDIDLHLATAAVIGITVIGFGVILRSRHVIVDAAERNVILCNATFLCFFRHWDRIPFEDLEAVKIDVVQEDRSIRLQVLLMVRNRSELVLVQHPDRDDALSEAEKVAKFIGIGLLDATMTGAMLRPEEVGLSVRDRVQLTGATEVPDIPHGARLKTQTMHGALQVTIPKPRLPWWRYTALLAGFSTFVVVALLTMLEGSGETIWVIIIVAPPLLALLFAAVVLPAVRLSTRITTLEISPAGLHIHEKRFMRKRATTISADDLIELEIVGASTSEDDGETKPILATQGADEGWLRDLGLKLWIGGPALLARSSSEKLTFGQGLSNEELNWLKAVIEQVLAAGVDGRDAEGSGQAAEGRTQATGEYDETD